jgi:hypothetical protein
MSIEGERYDERRCDDLAVVDELHPLVMHSFRFVPKPVLSCDFASRQFSSLNIVSGPHVPWMCPASAGDRLLRSSGQCTRDGV